MRCHEAGMKSLVQATLEVFGTIGRMKKVDFQGKTDPVILNESLGIMGLDEETIQNSTGRLKELYFRYLEEFIQDDTPVLLPGILEILTALSENDRVITGILTGNFTKSAGIKLGRFGLNRFFKVGAYGDDGAHRTELPPVARERMRRELGIDLDFGDIIIIGDTIWDIQCAKDHGAVSVAVGTGWVKKETLMERGPDFFFEDLSSTGEVVSSILNQRV